ncbi:Phosphatidate phosphatase LPIN3 isoform 1 [Schistosoma japonicum]|uniref:Acyl-CoA-binding domain-containing protein 6 n=1 Tax=Schistosoma japonicum TaxID=6182 RepID=A0A4Z2D4M4_SCHJA|nr:Phosphatidate phosphatase LPIN3 isoform 1 [Schistosoma japonicum]
MSWKSLGRLLSGIKGAYNDINPATLTGAIDVIVVEQKDGSFTCGPFHVRFGKLTAFSPTDKTVEIYVNGEFVDFLRMSLGSAGDAYFVDSSSSLTDEFLTADSNDCSGFTYDESWAGLSMRRQSRKIRRDSAMSEPGTESNLIEGDINEVTETSVYEVSSDCEASNDKPKDPRRCRNPVGNTFVSDTQLDEGTKDALASYGWGVMKCQSSDSSSNISRVVEEIAKSSTSAQNSHLKSFIHEKEVYLEELVTAEVDQNIKEVYIYPPSHGSLQSQSQGHASNNTADSGCVDYGYRSDNEHSSRSISPIHPHVLSLRLSLCGGLSPDSPCSEENFLEYMVSYEEFIRDPNAILSNPNLVVYFNGRYSNWQVTAPSIVSLLAFQTQLPYLTLQKLENQYFPKKPSRRTSWFSWGTSQTQISATNSLIPEEIGNPGEKSLNSSCGSQVPQVHGTHGVTKINRLSSHEVARLKLKPGRNDIEFRITTKYQGTCTCSASIYYWHWYDRIVVSDVDGTITRSDLLGHLLPMLGHDWTHPGVARLYNRVHNNGYQFLYLSARALGQAGITRSYLRQVIQDSTFRLPDGPILLSPNSLLHAFHQEVIINKPELFKTKCLQDVCKLFPEGSSPLYAGFGNKVNDVFAYQKAGIELCRIFTVNPRGEVRNEYQCLRNTTYQELGDLVDLHFPPLSECQTARKPYHVVQNSTSGHNVENSTPAELPNNFPLESHFEQAAKHLSEIAYSLDSNTLLYFYARYKQATVGPCNISKPGIFDVNGRKKWWTWHDLGHMSTKEAQKQYVDKLLEVDPAWKPSDEKQRSVYVSRMINLNPHSNEPLPTLDNDHSIFSLIKQHDLESLIRLLSVNCNEVNSLDKNEMTPLHWASDRGFSDMVSTLIKYNANVNSKDSEGQTPLHYGKTVITCFIIIDSTEITNIYEILFSYYICSQDIPSNIKCTSTTNNATNQPGLNIKSPPSS